MRNLKRALSLALASVMLLGMMVVGTSAASTDFADVDDIKNVEAVDIVSELGIFAGKGENNFGATDILTRAEMITLIVKMIEGPDFNANPYKALNTFSDIPAELDWAKGYINYAAQKGITAGYPNGTFKPGAEMTTAEAVTFLINALGVDAGEGTWPNTVMSKAIEMKLFGDLVLAQDAPMTRDDLSVLIVEGLLYGQEDSGKYSIIFSAGEGESAVKTDSQIVEEIQDMVFSSVLEAKAYIANLVTAGLVDGDDKTDVEDAPADNALNEKFGLRRFEGADKYGRPATNYWASVWADVEDFERPTYDVATPVFVYEGGVDTEVVEKDLKGYTYSGSNLIVDGNGAGAASESNIKTHAGYNMTKVEVYADADKVVTDVIVINTKAAIVAKAPADIKGEDDEVLVAKDGLYIEPTSENYYVIDLEGVAEGDVVLYTIAGTEILSVEAAEKIAGPMSGFAKVGTSYVYTIGGAEYVDVSDDGKAGSYAALNNVARLKADDQYAYYIGVNDTIVYAKSTKAPTPPAAPNTNYAIIDESGDVDVKVTVTTDAWSGDMTVKAQVKALLSNGTYGVYSLDVKKATGDVKNSSSVVANKGDYYIKVDGVNVKVYESTDVYADDVSGDVVTKTADQKRAEYIAEQLVSCLKLANEDPVIYTYTLSGSTLKLDGAAIDKFSGNEAATSIVWRNNKTEIKKGTTTIDAYNEKTTTYSKVIVNSDTKFLLADPDNAGKYVVKSGLANTTIASTKGVVVFDAVKGTDGKFTYVAQIVIADTVNFAKADAATPDAAGYVYVDGTYSVAVVDEKNVYTYIGIKADGTEITLTATAKDLKGIYAYNADNTIGSKASDAVVTVGANAGTTYDLGGEYLTVNSSTKVVALVEDAKLETGAKVIYVADADNVVTLIYVVEAAPVAE